VYWAQLIDVLPGLPAGTAEAAAESLASASALAADLPGARGQELLVAGREAFTTGLQVAAVVSAVALSVVAVVAVTMLRHVDPSAAKGPEQVAGDGTGSLTSAPDDILTGYDGNVG
jgi:DHA2 family multidrug resistance protein-like MFS transporter